MKHPFFTSIIVSGILYDLFFLIWWWVSICFVWILAQPIWEEITLYLRVKS